MGLAPDILRALEKMGYTKPSGIQTEAIPLILAGRDVMGLAQTGSGKTAACAIPICHMVDPSLKTIQGLIIVPTRELAMQYSAEVQKIGKVRHVQAFPVCGGESAEIQLSKIKHGVQIVVATPGRLIDFIYSRSIDLTHVKVLVLDEADEMLNMGFQEDVEFITQCLNHAHQTLLFSATMPETIRKIANEAMRDPVEVRMTPKDISPSNIEHRFIFCTHQERENQLVKLLETLPINQAIVFCKSRIQCEQLNRALQRHVGHVDLLHAGLSQELRSLITNKYRNGKIKVLVATDVAARGLDFSHVTHVFIYELTPDPDAYVHRSGRTGRFDKEGQVISFVTPRELSLLHRITTHIRQEPVWIGDPPPPGVHKRVPPPKLFYNKRKRK